MRGTGCFLMWQKGQADFFSKNQPVPLFLKKVACPLFLLLFFCANLYAQPALSVDNEIDLGVVSGEEILDKEFTVKNTGDSALVVKGVSSSCECIKITYPKKEIGILPQRDLKIKFKLAPEGYIGKVEKSIYLFSNDPKDNLKRVIIKFEVAKEKSKILKQFSNFNAPLILSAGLADGINPCAFSVIVFFISFLVFRGYSKKYLFIAGFSFLLSVFLTYVILGLGLLKVLENFESFFILSNLLYFIIAILAIVLGIISLRDYFQFKKTRDFSSMKLKLPKIVKDKIHRVIRDDFYSQSGFKNMVSLIFTGMLCGFLVSILESVCSGQLYLPTIAYIYKNTELRLQAFLWLLLYNFCFIMPLVIIFILALFGVCSESFSKFMQRHIGAIKIITALVFFTLGTVLILIKIYGI